jgi:HEAT repeat protein
MSLSDRKKALEKALQDPEETVRRAVSAAIDRIEGMERLGNLARTASAGEKSDRIRAIYLLGSQNTAESLEKVLPFLQDPEPDIRVAAVKAIGLHLPERAFIPLLGALEDPEQSVIQAVLETLSFFRDPRTTDFFLPFLQGQDIETACVAAKSLGRSGDPSAQPHLVKILEETRNPFLKIRAAEALGNLLPDPDQG